MPGVWVGVWGVGLGRVDLVTPKEVDEGINNVCCSFAARQQNMARLARGLCHG